MLSKKLCRQLLDGNLQDYGKYIAGTCKGFYVTVNTAENGMYVFHISAHSDNDPGNNLLRSYVESRKSTIEQIESADVGENCVTIVSTRTFLIKKVPAHVNEAVMPIIDYLASSGYSSGCMQCGGQNAQVDCYNINGANRYLCNDCAAKIEGALIDRKQDILSQKSNLAMGIVGALIGSLIGCVVYFLVWQLGYIAAVAGLITAVCAFKGYEMLGGVIDRKGAIACIIVIIFAVFFANQVVWAYDIYKAFKEDGFTFFECFRVIKLVVDEAELTGQYYGNLVMAYLLTAVGCFKTVMDVFKSSTGSYTVKKTKG